MLKYIYFGTPEISRDVLIGLIEKYGKPELVISSKDMPKGRGMKLTPPPVALYAKENNIALLQPEKLKDIKQTIEETKADVGILFAYGKIIPKWLLDIFPKGIINVHPSLLPRYRGASPLTGPILNGDDVTGITIMDMDDELDHGNIYLQDKINLGQETNRLDLEKYVVEKSPMMLKTVLDSIENNTVVKTPQNHTDATYTSKISKSDGELKEDDTNETKYRKYRAYIGWPGTYFFNTVDGVKTRHKIIKASMENGLFLINEVRIVNQND